MNPLKKETFLFLGFISVLTFGFICPLEWDMTQNKNNTLKAASQEILSTIQKPLKIELFTPEREIAHIVKDIVVPFQRKNKALSFEIHHSTLPPEEKLQLGLQSNHNLVLNYQGKTKAFDIKITHWNEEAFRNILSKILRENDQWILFLTNHGEPSPFGSENRNLSKLTLALKQKGINVGTLNLSEMPVIPDNTGVLVINDSKSPWLPKETALIETFIQQGGNLLWCVDPNSSNIHNDLSKILGITWLNGTVQDHKAVTLGAPDPNICVITQYPPHPLTAKQDKLTVFPWSIPLEFEQAEKLGWAVKPLIITNVATRIKTPEKNRQGPFALAVSLSKGKQRIVVIGNSHFLSNASIHNYGNLSFATNLFNWLSQNDKLLTTSEESALDSRYSESYVTVFLIHYGFPFILPMIYWLIGFLKKRAREKKYRFLPAF